MNKIIEYQTIYNSDLKDLNFWINEAIKKGWQPIGGIAVVYNSSGFNWYQAMVKYEEQSISTEAKIPIYRCSICGGYGDCSCTYTQQLNDNLNINTIYNEMEIYLKRKAEERAKENTIKD